MNRNCDKVFDIRCCVRLRKRKLFIAPLMRVSGYDIDLSVFVKIDVHITNEFEHNEIHSRMSDIKILYLKQDIK